MKGTEPIQLRKRKNKTVFLDTVVLGVVFLEPYTQMQRHIFIEKVRKDMYKIWN